MNPLSLATRDFASSFVPQSMGESRKEFLGAMFSPEAGRILQETFRTFATHQAYPIPAESLDGLGVTVFQESGRVVFVMRFPATGEAGEVLTSALVLGPLRDDSLTEEVITMAPWEYYLHQRDGAGQTKVLHKTGDNYEIAAVGIGLDIPSFTDWIVRSFGSHTNVFEVRSDDGAMRDAIEKARATLPEITRRFVAGELEMFTVKILIEQEGQKEHFWLSETAYDGECFSGVIKESGAVIKAIAPGTRMKVPPTQVTDWMFIDAGKIVGNYTLRAILPSLPPQERAQYQSRLAGYVSSDKAASGDGNRKDTSPLKKTGPPPLRQPREGERQFTYAAALSGWPDLGKLRKRARQLAGSKLFGPMYNRMHYGWFMLAAAALFQWWKKRDVKGLIAAAKNRGIKSPLLFWRYNSLGFTGELLLGHPIIANSNLSDEGDIALPALVLGCSDMSEAAQARTADLANRLARIYCEGSSSDVEEPLEELVIDDTYNQWRRRPVPPEFTGGLRMELFDVLLFPGQLPPREGPIPFLYATAKPGRRAPILHLPWEMVRMEAEHDGK